jgi:hypothetical protein
VQEEDHSPARTLPGAAVRPRGLPRAPGRTLNKKRNRWRGPDDPAPVLPSTMEGRRWTVLAIDLLETDAMPVLAITKVG